MIPLQSLRHVSNCIHIGEVLADESEDLGETELAARLRHRAAELRQLLDDVVKIFESTDRLRLTRLRAHEVLTIAYNESSTSIEHLMPPETASRLSPGGHLDVVERVRFRLRHLPKQNVSERLLDVRVQLERALLKYDESVDDYLFSCAHAQCSKELVIVQSQALRVEMERVKARLLVVAGNGSEAWKRLKRRPVRTKRARWLDDAKAKQLLAEALAG